MLSQSWRLAAGAALLVGASIAMAEADDFSHWSRQQAGAFAEYRAAQDAEFAQYLREEWQSFARFKAEQRDAVPKPARQPHVTEAGAGKGGWQRQQIPPTTGFYGLDLRLPDCALPVSITAPYSPEQLAQAWEALNMALCPGLPATLEQVVRERRLGDAGLWRLAQWTAQHYAQAPAARAFLTWTLLLRLGVDARLGYGDKNLVVLLPIRERVYGASYFELQGRHYYAFGDLSHAPLHIHAARHAQASRILSFRFAAVPRLPTEKKEKPLRFLWRGEVVAVPLQWDQALARWYAEYPQLPLPHYFAAARDPQLLDRLGRALAPHTAALTTADALDFLLAFVQQGIAYATDEEQFGHEAYLLPEQVFAYDAADCEDRAVLFTALARHLLGVRVVGVDWPGHVATAVQLPAEGLAESPPGLVRAQGRRYVIADPTYKGARLGLVMPQFQGRAPALIADLDDASR